MKAEKPEIVTIRMSIDQKDKLIKDCAAIGASLNQYILIKCGLQTKVVKVHAMRGRRPKSKKPG